MHAQEISSLKALPDQLVPFKLLNPLSNEVIMLL